MSSLDLFAGRLALLGPRSNDNLTACSYGAGTGQFVVALRKLNVHDIPHRESADRPQRRTKRPPLSRGLVLRRLWDTGPTPWSIARAPTIAPANDCFRRISPAPVRPGGGPVTEPTPAVQPSRWEQLFTPLSRHSREDPPSPYSDGGWLPVDPDLRWPNGDARAVP